MEGLKLWIDDLRSPPDKSWTQAFSSAQAINYIIDSHECNKRIEAISFDHDLGGTDTSRPIVLVIIAHDWWPENCFVHTANPVGREWLIGMIQRYAPKNTLER